MTSVNLKKLSNILRSKRKILSQARNPEIFRAGEFSRNWCTLISNHVQREKERPRREKSPVFPPGNP